MIVQYSNIVLDRTNKFKFIMLEIGTITKVKLFYTQGDILKIIMKHLS